MTDVAERVARDLREIATHANASPSAWRDIRARIEDGSSDPDTHQMEVVMLTPNRQSSKSRPWMVAVAAAAVLAVGAFVVIRAADDDDPPPAPADTQTTIDTAALPTTIDSAVPPTTVDVGADTQTALEIANQFIAARDTWDADTMRALLADDAVI